MKTMEQAMLSILRTHLAEPEMGVDDDFYAMGGDSLIALRVVAEANESGIPIELRDLLFHPTVRELSAVLDGPRQPAGDNREPSAGPLGPYDRSLVPPGVAKVRPTSALQLGLIYLCESARDPGLYHDLLGLEVFGPFDDRRFAQALGALCERHEALRSSFDIGGFSEPVQLVWSEVAPPLVVERAASPEVATRWRQRELGRGIDWERPPLLRCHVVALPDSFHVTLAIHHAVIDGWSYARVVTELLLLYDAGRPVSAAS